VGFCIKVLAHRGDFLAAVRKVADKLGAMKCHPRLIGVRPLSDASPEVTKSIMKGAVARGEQLTLRSGRASAAGWRAPWRKSKGKEGVRASRRDPQAQDVEQKQVAKPDEEETEDNEEEGEVVSPVNLRGRSQGQSASEHHTRLTELIAAQLRWRSIQEPGIRLTRSAISSVVGLSVKSKNFQSAISHVCSDPELRDMLANAPRGPQGQETPQRPGKRAKEPTPQGLGSSVANSSTPAIRARPKPRTLEFAELTQG
jgi:hypothetical protein